jgi:hypothetical protein
MSARRCRRRQRSRVLSLAQCRNEPIPLIVGEILDRKLVGALVGLHGSEHRFEVGVHPERGGVDIEVVGLACGLVHRHKRIWPVQPVPSGTSVEARGGAQRRLVVDSELRFNGCARLPTMANTTALQAAIEWARETLAAEHRTQFSKRPVHLRTGGTHTFNAVAADGRIVATVMNSSGATSGGKKPTGKIRGAIAELYFLSLVVAPSRILVVTNASFLSYLEQQLEGALTEGLSLVHLELPPDLAAAVAAVSQSASDEMS